MCGTLLAPQPILFYGEGISGDRSGQVIDKEKGRTRSGRDGAMGLGDRDKVLDTVGDTEAEGEESDGVQLTGSLSPLLRPPLGTGECSAA
eukprot:1176716-Prorocentrum_minimum.AAC.3